MDMSALYSTKKKMLSIWKKQRDLVKNPSPEDLALIYPQRGFMMPVISVFLE